MTTPDKDPLGRTLGEQAAEIAHGVLGSPTVGDTETEHRSRMEMLAAAQVFATVHLANQVEIVAGSIDLLTDTLPAVDPPPPPPLWRRLLLYGD
jgi:hypothetical protein